jgi:hypothetical protein
VVFYMLYLLRTGRLTATPVADAEPSAGGGK